MNNNIIWRPHPKQVEFMKRGEYEVLYGGAAGGGKSDALVIEALRQVDNPNYRAIIFRKTYPQCRELIIKSLRFYPAVYPDARYNSTEHIWTFPSGAKIYFGSMPNSMSYLNYQGLSYSFIAFDELTHFTQDEYEYLISRNRADGPGLRVYIRATANPGGIGHGWVKERFISPVPPGTVQKFTVDVPDGRGGTVTKTRRRVFIQSSVFDNPALIKNDPNYVINLSSLPQAQKKALLYGDWDSFSGQVFTEWRNDPEGYQTHLGTHVIEPFTIPGGWRRYRSMDWGFSKPYTVQWWAVDYEGRAYLYRELYGARENNVGSFEQPAAVARKVREIEEQLEKGNDIYGVADPAIWDESHGHAGTIITAFEKEGIFFDKGKNQRLSGKMQVHIRFAFDESNRPRAYVFNTCKDFIRTVPNLVYDEHHVEDVNTAQEDHDYDAMRYFFMLNPLPSELLVKPKEKLWDPLSTTL